MESEFLERQFPVSNASPDFRRRIKLEVMRQRTLQFLFFLCASLPALGQRLEFGVKAGVPVTESFETSSYNCGPSCGVAANSATRRYTIGPTVGVRLRNDLSVEFDALYSRLGFDRHYYNVYADTHTRATANCWEFPILAKFRLSRAPVLRPFVAGGVSFRATHNVSSIMVTTITIPNQPSLYSPGIPVSANSDVAFDNRSHYGGVIGVGGQRRVGRVSISPEVRYTRWAEDHNADYALHSNQNQVTFLVGITL